MNCTLAIHPLNLPEKGRIQIASTYVVANNVRIGLAGRVSMRMTQSVRMFRGLAGLGAICLALSACTSSPTYGTGTTAMEQLVDDLGSSVSLAPQEKPAVRYSARPGLVVAPNVRQSQLNQPQTTLASREANSAWLESPEETRRRLRDEADANQNNPNYRSPLAAGYGTNGQLTETQKWEAFRKAKAEAEGGNVVNTNKRRYLTDPPQEYRMAAPEELSDLGEPETKKERQRKKDAANAGTGSNWWNPFK